MPSAFNPCARHSPPVPAPTIRTFTRLPTVAACMPTSCLPGGGEPITIRYRPVNGLSGRKGPLIWSNDSVKSVEPIRRRGRPRDLDKLHAILDAASALFLERGIAGTTMESVAERACVSKMTVYGHFRDKPSLLSAVFERNIKAIRLPDLAIGPDPTSSLAEFGERLVWFLTRPEIVRTAWVMAACADENPRLAAAFYAAGPGTMLKKVAGLLKSLAERGILPIDDPELAAEQLIVSWLGLSQLRQNLGVAGPPSADAIARRVRYATDTMLRAWSSASLAGGKAGAVQRRRCMPRDATMK